MGQVLSTNTFTVARWVVSADPTQGTHTTIAGALASAVSGDTIWIRGGTYTEDLTLKAGVTLTAATGNNNAPIVTIVGKCSFSAAGTTTINNVSLQTNSDNFLSVTGSDASRVILNNCFLNCSNNTGISFTSSSSSAFVQTNFCFGNLGTTGVALYSSSSDGQIVLYNTTISNSGGSSTISSNSAGQALIFGGTYSIPFGSTGTGGIGCLLTTIDSSATNTITVTTNGTGTTPLRHSTFSSGTAATVSIGAGATASVHQCVINSSNANPITGAGTVLYSLLTFGSSGNTINTSTATKVAVSAIYSPNGITFDNTNVLSDYSTGSFTPTIVGTVTAGTGTYTTQNGRYTRIGNRLFYNVAVVWTAHTGTGNIRMTGLPFTVRASDGSAGTFSQISTLAVGAGLIPMIQAQSSNTALLFATYNSTTAAYAGIGIVGAATLVFSGSYEIQ